MQIDYEKYQDELVLLRRYFHSHPELSLEEKETSLYIQHYLRILGLEFCLIGDYGVVSTVYSKTKSEKTVAIRLEMDAIAVTEINEVPYKSLNEGVMHACGHDAIVACGLVLAKICQENRDDLPVNVKFIFQQAEENGKGTQMMIEGNALNHPHVDYFILFHFVNDAPSGLELHRGASSAAIGSVQVKIAGKSAHWATQELGINAMDVATDVLSAIKSINQTYVSTSPFVLGMGTIEGGTAKNVVAGEVEMQGTLRACRIEDYYRIKDDFTLAIETINKNTKAKIELDITDQPVPPIMNDDTLVDLGMKVGKRIWQERCRFSTIEYLSGDSAAYYFDECKGIYFIFTAQKENEIAYPLHNGKFDIDECIMGKSVAFLHQFILELMK